MLGCKPSVLEEQKGKLDFSPWTAKRSPGRSKEERGVQVPEQ